MNREVVIGKIKKAAKEAGLPFVREELSKHTGVTVGGKRTTISRSSKDVPNVFAETIWKQLEEVLGKGWWKK